MTTELANVFLMVSLNEGQRLTDYARDTGLSQSTISRHLMDLSGYRRDLSETAAETSLEGMVPIKPRHEPRPHRHHAHRGGTGVHTGLYGVLPLPM